MKTYASTFIVGFTDIIIALLKEVIKDIQIIETMDGLLVYKTNTEWEQIKSIPALNNTFEIVSILHSNQPKELLKATELLPKFKEILEQYRTFRVVVSEENELRSLPVDLRKSIEQKIRQTTKLSINGLKPDVEFWFLTRSEGLSFFGIRLTNQSYNNKLQKGELRPELSYILSYMSEPSENDIFLDPFSGTGSIAKQRLIFPFEKIIVNDINEENINSLKRTFKSNKKIQISKENAFKLSIANGSIDKIVTDPPWGYYDNNETNQNEFYINLLEEITRLLKVNGLAVILTARKDEIAEAIKNQTSLKLVQKLNILVSGKKAGVFKLEKYK